MKIKLQSGKEIYLEAFYCTPTYAGLLIGSPTKESNANLIKNLNHPSDWGKKISILKKSDMFVSENILKPIINFAWISSEPINNKDNQFDGSNLVAIWFSDENFNKSLNEIIIKGVGNLDYDKYAENFQF